MDQVNANIERLKVKLAEAQGALSNSTGGADGQQRKELKQKLEEARKEYNEVQDLRQKLVDRLRKSQQEIKSKVTDFGF